MAQMKGTGSSKFYSVVKGIVQQRGYGRVAPSILSDAREYSVTGTGATFHHISSLYHTYKQDQLRDRLDGPWYYFQPIRYYLRTILEETETYAGKTVAIFVFTVILLSTVTFCVSTVPSIANGKLGRVLQKFEKPFIIFFVIEYILRLFAATNRLQFVLEFKNIVDMFAVAPFLLERFIPQTLDLRFLRIIRIFRVFKLSRYTSKMQMVVNALTRSRDMLAMLVVNLLILIILFSSCVYYAERDAVHPTLCEEGYVPQKKYECTPFKSIPDTFWWCIVTVLTVGYGDVYPHTAVGKLLAAVLMIVGVIVLALPITIVGSNFGSEWNAFQQEQLAVQRVRGMNTLVRGIYPALIRWVEQATQNNQMVVEKLEENRIILGELKDGKSKSQDYILDRVSRLLQTISVLQQLMSSDVTRDIAAVGYLNTQIGKQREISLQNQKGYFSQLTVIEEQVEDSILDLQARRGQEVARASDEADLFDNEGFVHIHLIGGRNIISNTGGVASDYCVTFKHRSQFCRSTVIKKSLNPMFDQSMVMMLEQVQGMLHIQLIDDLKLQDGKETGNEAAEIGNAEIALSDLNNQDVNRLWVPLQKSPNTKLRMDITVYSFDSLKHIHRNAWPALLEKLTSENCRDLLYDAAIPYEPNIQYLTPNIDNELVQGLQNNGGKSFQRRTGSTRVDTFHGTFLKNSKIAPVNQTQQHVSTKYKQRSQRVSQQAENNDVEMQRVSNSSISYCNSDEQNNPKTKAVDSNVPQIESDQQDNIEQPNNESQQPEYKAHLELLKQIEHQRSLHGSFSSSSDDDPSSILQIWQTASMKPLKDKNGA